MSHPHRGLLAVDRQGNRVLFLHPDTFAIQQVLNALPPRPQQLLMLPALEKAYVTLAHDASHHGASSGCHALVIIDLRARDVAGYVDLTPLRGPHSGQLGRDGKVYFCCEGSASVAVIDPQTDRLEKIIPLPAHHAHRLSLSPSGRKLFTENHADASITVLDLCEAEGRIIDNILLAGPIAGIAASPKHPYLVACAADAPQLYVVDRQSHRVRQRILLTGHQQPCHQVRFSANGDRLVAMGAGEPVVTLFDDLLNPLGDIEVANPPTEGCFSEDNRTLLIAHEEEGALSVIDLAEMKVIAVPQAGAGCDALSYFSLH